MLYNEAVSLRAESVPSGVNLQFEPETLKHGDKTISQVTVSIGKNTLPGEHLISIIGYGSDGKEHDCKLKLTVSAIPTTGSISISSSPTSASVYLDGKYQGEAPKVLDGIEQGPHDINLKLKGHEDFYKTTNVVASETTSVLAELKQISNGSISVSSSPSGASIFLDGKYQGETPKTLSNIKQGSHTLSLKLKGYENWDKLTNVTAGETTSEFAELSPESSIGVSGGSEATVKITYPSNEAQVNIQETVTGTATNVPEVQKLWILVYPLSANKFYPQNPNVNIINEEWAITVGIGTKDNVGETFRIIAVLADQKAHEEFINYISTGPGKGWPGMDNIPKSARVVDEVTVKRGGPVPEVKITSPLSTAKLSDTITGTLKNIPEGKTVWISVYPKSASKYYPQNKVDNENWNLPVQFGEEKDKGAQFDIIAVLADQSAQNELKAYYDKCKNESIWPGMENLPIGTKELGRVTVIRE